MKKINKSVFTLFLVFLLSAFVPALFAAGQQDQPVEEEPVLRVGVLGVMSGHAASWGLVCKYSVEAMARIYNEDGGVEIDGTKYRVEVSSVDTKQDPKIAVTGAERLIAEGIHYVVGTNIHNTAMSISGVFEDAGVMYMPYSQDPSAFRMPRTNALAGMVIAEQSAPIIYEWLKDNRGITRIAFVARNQPDPLKQRDAGVAAARKLGLDVISYKDTYEPGTQDFSPVMAKVINQGPQLIVLSGASPADAPHLINAARDQGYKGLFSAETAHDLITLNQVSGSNADGFIFVGGATTPEIETEYMKRFRRVYEEIAGEWNDEAGTKVYGLPAFVWGLQEAGKEALTDVEVFKEAMPRVSVVNPFVNDGRKWNFTGEATYGHLRQVKVPVVINEVRNGKLETLFVGSVD